MTTEMLSAYYDRLTDFHRLFARFEIATHLSHEQHINRYNALFINMQDFRSLSANMNDMLLRLQGYLGADIVRAYPDSAFRGYDTKTKDVFIPNKEIRDRYVTVMKPGSWPETIEAAQASKALLKSALTLNANAAARKRQSNRGWLR
jgi:hypothetical protein